MTFKGILQGAAAVLFAAVAAGAANLSIFSGPQDPSQMLATVNQLVQNINTGVSGRLYFNGTTTGTTTTGSDSTLFTYSLPASTLAATGDAVRVVCWGASPANTNTKSASIFFGAQQISTASVMTAPNLKNWKIAMTVIRNGAAVQVLEGGAQIDLTPSSQYSTLAGTETLTSAVTIKCIGRTVTALQDITGYGMYVEQIK